MLSFREMTDEERALARKAPLGRFAEGHLRVINGQYPTREPMAGQPLKIVE